MQKDPIVEEIRDLRKAHAAKFNYDLKAICIDMKKKEKNVGTLLFRYQRSVA